MTPTLSRQFFETFPPEVARAILEGRPLRIHAAKVSVVRDKTGAAFAIDTLPRDGRPAISCCVWPGQCSRDTGDTRPAPGLHLHFCGE